MSDQSGMSGLNNQSDETHGSENVFAGDADGRIPQSELAQRDEASVRVVVCPYCQSQDVTLLALFGAQLLTDQYYCNACHTPFEHVRDE